MEKQSHKFYDLKVKEIIDLTKDAKEIRFEIPSNLKEIFAFKAGQYLTLRTMIGGEDLRRPYSICSVSGQDYIAVGVRKIDQGLFSTYLHQALKTGDTLKIMPPQGKFGHKLEDKASNSVLLIALGSGITPILAIIHQILTLSSNPQILLIYGNRSHETIMFLDELEGLKNLNMSNLSLIHILSQEQQDSEINYGRINLGKLQKLITLNAIDLNNYHQILLCGPPDFSIMTKQFFVDNGFAPEKIETEIFTPATPQKHYKAIVSNPDHSAEMAKITIILDGKKKSFALQYPDQTILEAAQAAGLDLPFSCAGGMCATCRCKVSDGEVKMDQNYSLEPWELSQGFRLACQSHPITPSLTLDFDAM